MTQEFNEERLTAKMTDLFDNAKEKYSEQNNTDESYEDNLNIIYGEVQICGMTFDSGRALKELDPIAFRVRKSEAGDRFYETFEEENNIEDFRDEALESLDMEDKE